MKKKIVKLLCSISTFIILFATLINISAFAISESCVTDHFERLRFLYDEENPNSTDNKTRTPPNDNTCPYATISMLLMFCDSYWNDSFVDDDLEWTPGIYDSEDCELIETFTASEEAADWEEYLSSNYPGLNENAYKLLYRIYATDNSSNFLESYLVSLGLELNLHPDQNEPLGLNDEEMLDVLDYYLYDKKGFNTSEVEVKYLQSDHETVKQKMTEVIGQGFPLIYIGKAETSPNVYMGHAFIAYGVDETGDIQLHTGISGNEFEMLSTTAFSHYQALLWLEINENDLPHSHSYNYVDSDLSETYCSCQIYSSHPAHVHWGPDCESYTASSHSIKCLCGITYTQNHSFQYSPYNDSQHRMSCGCGYSVYLPHIAGGKVGNFRRCIQCGHLIGSGDLVYNSIITPTRYLTDSGTYLASNGIIYLSDEDLKRYLDGELDLNILAFMCQNLSSI